MEYNRSKGKIIMLEYTLLFFLIALIASVLGYGQIAGMSVDMGKFFAVLAVIFLLVSLFTGFHLPRL